MRRIDMLRSLALVLALPISTALAADPAHTDGDKYKVRFENEKVRVLEYRDLPGQRTHQHDHPNFVVYALTSFKRKLFFADGREVIREFKAGDVMWQPPQTHIGENIGDVPTHIMMIELK
jgi:quercetin dioxygenase-like cupin family protein